VRGVAFSPDSSLIATASSDRNVGIYETVLGSEFRKLTGHDAGLTAVAFSPDGSLIATASDDHTARIWRTMASDAAPTVLRGHADGLTAVAFSRNGSLIVTTSADTTARIWNTATGALLGTLVTLPGGGSALLLVDGSMR
jgi:WD40 repeat protein